VLNGFLGEGCVVASSERLIACSLIMNIRIQTTDRHSTFTCHDLEPSAFLWARGARFVGIEPSPTTRNPNHVVFRFHDPDGLCKQEVSAFEQGAEISAQQYALALKQLKDQIFRRVLR
jgi:hypothetical protein